MGRNTRVRLSVDKAWMDALKTKLGNRKLTNEQVASEALSMFNWAAEKASQGKKIVALDGQSGTQDEVVTPLLDKTPRKQPPKPRA